MNRSRFSGRISAFSNLRKQPDSPLPHGMVRLAEAIENGQPIGSIVLRYTAKLHQLNPQLGDKISFTAIPDGGGVRAARNFLLVSKHESKTERTTKTTA